MSDVITLVFRYPDHRIKIFKLSKPISRRLAVKFRKDMGIKGYVRPELSYAILKNGWCV
jgi:hypothetical protein